MRTVTFIDTLTGRAFWSLCLLAPSNNAALTKALRVGTQLGYNLGDKHVAWKFA